MPTRTELIERLSAVPTLNLLDFMEDKTLHELARRYFEHLEDAETQRVALSNEVQATNNPPATITAKRKVKKALNAFIAFRTYYLRMFPEIPQKFISGFFSSLWGPDPHHTRWALVAKVYSFVRDEIGKEKISLSNFLDIACPLMRITDPASYLSTLGWHVHRTEGEVPQLIRHDPSSKPDLKVLESDEIPTTEFDLLLAVLKVGFLPSCSSELIRKMSANGNALMTSSSVAVSRLHSDSTIEKLNFMNILREDPGEAAKKLFGQHYDESIMRETGYKIHDVESLSEIQHIPLHRPLDPRCFPYSNLQPQKDPNLNMPMDISGITEHECYDVGNSHDLNAMIGFESFLTDAALPTHNDFFNTESPPYSPRNDFNILY